MQDGFNYSVTATVLIHAHYHRQMLTCLTPLLAWWKAYQVKSFIL